MVIYIFQCSSLKSSHLHLCPESKSLFFTSVSLVALIGGLSIPPFWIPNLCTNILYFCFSLWLTSLCIIGSSFTHLIRTDSNVFFFYSWVIFHCVYVPQLPDPLICWWTSRLLPCPSCCKQCCSEYWGTCVSFNFGFLGVYAQQWGCWVVWHFYFQFFKESPHCSSQWLHQFAFPPSE